MKPLILFILLSCSSNLLLAQNLFPSTGTTLLNSGTDQNLILRDGRTGTNWNYIEWQFSNGSRDWVLGRRITTGNFTLYREGLNEVLTVDNSGNFGINTTTPTAKFEIKSTGSGGSTLFYGGIIGSKANGHELNLVGGMPIDGQFTSQLGGHIRLGGSARGDSDKNAIQFLQNGAEKMRINDGGNLGLGTSTPASKLSVNGNIQISNSSIPMGLMTEVGGYNPILNLSLNFREPDRNNSYKGAAFRIDSRDNYQLFQWLKRDGGDTNENLLMSLLQNGNLGIGTASPTQKLTVNGTIYGKEVRVDVGAGGPDYVFEKDYKLPTLDEIKSYIDQHKHLSEVPSAKEMEQNGINLSEMNMILLKKVEELTLLLINQQQQLTDQQKQIDRLKK